MIEPPGLRMSVGAAVAWSCGTILVFWFFAGLIASFRQDLIALFACEAVALLGGAALVWLLYGRAPAPQIAPPAADSSPPPRPLEAPLEFFAARSSHPGMYPLALLLGIAIHLPVEAIFRFIEQRWPGPSPDLARTFLDAGPAKKVVIGAILVVIGPLVEEIFFRGALFRPLRRTTSAVATIAVTSVMFAISHFAPQTYVPIAIVGVALGVLRHASGSLMPPFVLHAAFNGLSLLAMATTGTDEAASRSSPPLWVTLAGTAVTLGLVAWLWVLGARARGEGEAALR
ncbi:MAG: CPBP family intramembrane metalloprotease [Polyangiaceae bacterium]|nr:CPBP family intramembrane metalloprotease [Polyangiaceae bacterium]